MGYEDADGHRVVAGDKSWDTAGSLTRWERFVTWFVGWGRRVPCRAWWAIWETDAFMQGAVTGEISTEVDDPMPIFAEAHLRGIT